MSGAFSKVARARALPPSLLAKEAAWRLARHGIELAARARDGAVAPARRFAPVQPRPFLLPPDPAAVAARVTDADRAKAVSEAEAALAGRFDILGFGRVDFGSPPAWHADPVRGFTWAPDSRDATLGQADVKVPWEASRMHWLVALARAARYSGDAALAEGARRLLRDWIERNPAGQGVNWANAMEAGIRAVNLAWAAELFGDDETAGLCGGLLRAHGQFITEHLEYSPRLTSNHYLADVVGLLYCGAALRHTARGRAWLSFARRALFAEVTKQFHFDGGNFEASTLYHRLSTELVLLGLAALCRLDASIPDEVLERFALALDALRVVTKPDGKLVAVGDDDSGLAVGLASERNPRDPAPVLRAGAALLDALPDDPAGPADELSLWLTGRSPAPPAPAGPTSLPATGWHLLADGPLWCLAECGGVGQNGNGGHAHNDTLSFTLCVNGAELVGDPGTGEYTGDPDLRNRLRATAAHATVEVDGQEVNRLDPSALFMMGDDDRAATDRAALSSTGEQVVMAHHDGYARLADAVRHTRTWRLADGVLTVTDELRSTGPHTATVTFPLAPGVDAEPVAGGWLLTTPGGGARLCVEQGPLALERAEAAWSSRYGAAQSSLALRGDVDVPAGGLSWTVTFTPIDKESR